MSVAKARARDVRDKDGSCGSCLKLNDTQMELTVPVDVFKTGFGASCVFMIRVPNRNRPSECIPPPSDFKI